MNLRNTKHKIKGFIVELYKKCEIYFLSIAIVLSIYLLIPYFDTTYFTLQYGCDSNDSSCTKTIENFKPITEVIRNLGLVFLGIGAIFIAVWRGRIANDELKNSNLKLDNEKFHKAVDLLESNSELNSISAFVMLKELIEKNTSFHEIVFQIVSTYLKEHSNTQKSFAHFEKEYKDLDIDKKIEKWYARDEIPFSIILCYRNYKFLIEKYKIKTLNQIYLTFNNFDLHGSELMMPNTSIYNSDLSSSTLHCKENTKFINCDLTHARVIPYQNNTLIFDNCNISNLKLEVLNDIEPTINGWHWEGKPPLLNSDWESNDIDRDIRVIVMPLECIYNDKEKYYKTPYNIKQLAHPSIFGKPLNYEKEEQSIISIDEYIKLQKQKNEREN